MDNISTVGNNENWPDNYIEDLALAAKKKSLLNFDLSSKDSVSATVAGIMLVGSLIGPSTPATATQINHHINSTDSRVVRTRDRIAKRPSLSVSSESKSRLGKRGLSQIDLISFIRNHVELSYSSNLANRIEHLLELSIEERLEGQHILNSESLNCFINFIKDEKNIREPELVLSFNGNLRAEWRESRKKHFVAEFLPNGQARYVLFSQDEDFPSKIDRISGIVSAKSLMRKNEPFGVISWVYS